MPKYNVNLLKTVSFSITVEAEHEDAAIDAAYEVAPSICAQCRGWGQEYGVDDSNEWQTIEDFNGRDYDEKLHGHTVETQE